MSRETLKQLVPAIVALAAAAVALGACASGPTIRADWDHSVDFSRYRSFGFLTDPNAARSLSLQTLQASATREMEARGFTRVEEKPDLLIHFKGQIEQRTEIESVPAPMWGPSWGYRGWQGAPFGGWGSELRTRRFDLGTLVMDIVDPEKRQVVFQAGMEDVVTQRMRDDMRGTLDEAVAQLFAEFPFAAGGSTPAVTPQADGPE